MQARSSQEAAGAECKDTAPGKQVSDLQAFEGITGTIVSTFFDHRLTLAVLPAAAKSWDP